MVAQNTNGFWNRTGLNQGEAVLSGLGNDDNLATISDVITLIGIHAGGGSSIFAARVSTVAQMKALDMTTLNVGNLIWVDGYHSNWNIGGGVFIVRNSTWSDDGGHTIAPNVADGNKKFWRFGTNPLKVDITNFGALPDDGATDINITQIAMENAMASLVAATARGTPIPGDAVNTNGAWLEYICPSAYNPNGVSAYRMNDEIIIPGELVGLKIHGGGVLRQHTLTAGHFICDPDGTGYPSNTMRFLETERISYEWASNTSDPGAVAFFFRRNPTLGGCVNNFRVTHCYFRRGYRGMSGEGNGYCQNIKIKACDYQNMSGSFVHLPTAGNVAPTINDCWIQGPGFIEPVFDISSAFTVNIRGNSFEGTNDSSPAVRLLFANCANVIIDGDRWEWGNIGNTWLIRCENSSTTCFVQNINMQNQNVSDGEFGGAVYMHSGKGTINGTFTPYQLDIQGNGNFYCGGAKGWASSNGQLWWNHACLHNWNAEGNSNFYLRPPGTGNDTEVFLTRDDNHPPEPPLA